MTYELHTLVPVLVEKDLAQQYATQAGVLDLRSILNNQSGGAEVTFGSGDPGVEVTGDLYWDTTGKYLWINDPNDGWTKL